MCYYVFKIFYKTITIHFNIRLYFLINITHLYYARIELLCTINRIVRFFSINHIINYRPGLYGGRRKSTKCIRQNISFMSTIITVLLCIRFGRADIDHAGSARGNTTDYYSAVVLVTIPPRVTVSRINDTNRPATEIQDELSSVFQDFRTPSVTTKNDSIAELLRVNSNTSLNDSFFEENFKNNDKNLYLTDLLLSNNDTTVGDVDEPNQSKETAVTEIHQANNRYKTFSSSS